MKINYILPSVFKSGGAISIYEYANRLTELGNDVILYYPIFPLDGYKNSMHLLRVTSYFKVFKYHLKNVLQKNFYFHKFKIKFVPIINNNFIRNADFTIATTWHTAYKVKKLQSSKGSKIYFIQGYEDWDSNIELVDKSYLLGLNCITISIFLQNFLESKFNLKSFLIYNGFDSKKLYFENIKKDFRLRKILFIDYGGTKKNVPSLLHQINKVKLKYPYIEFLSFGLHDYTKKPMYVKFYKNIDENTLRNLYNESDLFIFPSLFEGFGNPPVEAMACKCAVASTLVGGVSEYLIDNENGFILKNDLSNLLEIVDTLINDSEKLKRISEKGNESVEKFLNWDFSISRLIHYLNSLGKQ
ncbi:MAG: glycosyltransferase family 4 protein [Ignavibacteria bacterium]|nr:glycosyltransferase family 4 protein [Ignavibacteria bacterium]